VLQASLGPGQDTTQRPCLGRSLDQRQDETEGGVHGIQSQYGPIASLNDVIVVKFFVDFITGYVKG
jgi:hypothetical protein